jgi:two-component system sensor histidine kinase VanS
MRYSIRLKLFLVFVVLLLFFQLLFLVTNAYFLDDIFIWGNKRLMVRLYEDFKGKLDSNFNEEEYIHDINNDFGGNIALIDRNLEIGASTYSRFARDRFGRLSPGLRGFIQSTLHNKEQEVFFNMIKNNNIHFNTLLFLGKLPDGRLLLIEKPYGVVYESSRIAQQFIIISGIGTLLMGSVLIFYLSGRLTKPIIRINEAAKEIANLNFGSKVYIPSKDEIGALGSSINLISDKLSQSLQELIEANEKLREDIEKERKLERMRRRFVSNVSHELKTPLSMIQGYADGLKHNIAKTPEEARYYCEVIIDESEKMSHLIKDLLDLSAYESGIFRIVKSNFDLGELVKETVYKFKTVLEGKNVGLAIEERDRCTIYGDKLRIEQVIRNFMSNAGRYVDRNGTIRIRFDKAPSGVWLSFFNSGQGIAEEEQKNIWASFYRIESDKGAGTGLGLAIVKAIAEMHGGSCGVYNTEGGVVFWIELPDTFE